MGGRFNPVILNFRGSRWIAYSVALAFIVPLLWNHWLRLGAYNGFDLSGTEVDARLIEGGGPGRDDIPALYDPSLISGKRADYLADEDLVLGLNLEGEARAYPLAILNWHEIVNDRLGSHSLVVTYCPLCGTGMAFASRHQGERLLFGVSGLLYRDNLLMFDRASHSLWSQMLGEAISGPLTGAVLHSLPMSHMSWGEWRDRHPHTTVLSPATGYWRRYQEDPYREYEDSRHAPSGQQGDYPIPGKAWVIGVRLGDAAKAYPYSSRTVRAIGCVGRQVGRAGDSYRVRRDCAHCHGAR